MAGVTLLVLSAVVLVSLLSLAGVLAMLWRRVFGHTVMLALVALAAGTLMGDAMLHLIPEAIEVWTSDLHRMGALVLAGFVLLFVLEVVLRWRHSHAEHLEEAHGHGPAVQPFGWINLVGDGVHNLIDGVVIAAAFLVDVRAGIATTVAVALHEIPQEIGDFAVLVRAGMRPRRALLLNLGSAGLAVVGAVLVLSSGLDADALERYALPLIAGAFLYIAAADLIPELHHHSRGKETALILASFVAGLGVMGLLLLLEGA